MNSNRAAAIGTVALVLTLGDARGQMKRDPFQPTIDSASVARLEEARVMLRQGKEQDAVARLQQLIQARPDYYRAHYNLGLALSQQGKLDDALAALQSALAVRDRNGIQDDSIFNSLGWVQMLRGDYMAAEPLFLQAAAHESSNSAATNTKVFNNLGLLYLYRGDFDNSRKYLSRAATKYGSAQARRNLELLKKMEVQRAASAARNK